MPEDAKPEAKPSASPGERSEPALPAQSEAKARPFPQA